MRDLWQPSDSSVEAPSHEAAQPCGGGSGELQSIALLREGALPVDVIDGGWLMDAQIGSLVDRAQVLKEARHHAPHQLVIRHQHIEREVFPGMDGIGDETRPKKLAILSLPSGDGSIPRRVGLQKSLFPKTEGRRWHHQPLFSETYDERGRRQLLELRALFLCCRALLVERREWVVEGESTYATIG